MLQTKSDRPENHRSGCPINLSLEVFGDKWSLIVIRDMMFGGRRRFRELLTGSLEGIASNILADRLRHLVEIGVLTRVGDPSHKQKAIYSLTEMGIQLLPVFVSLGAWGRKFLPVSEELSIRAQLLEEGGEKLWEQFMAELRAEHLSDPPVVEAIPRPGSVRAKLQAAYEAVVARNARKAAG
jgi:DNA-binding HxlR family transcriptional regulator